MHKGWQIQKREATAPPAPMPTAQTLFLTFVSTSESPSTQCFKKLLPTSLLKLIHKRKEKEKDNGLPSHRVVFLILFSV